MELPNYSQQLLQQLYALCREQQFCDCSILVGTVHFRAHKLVLAAASLLFKSALDGSDTVSIDASLVAPDDFALLLEMLYTGKLPLGKHHFSKVISVADSLQMFDMAVSCKTLLRELLSCSNQDQGPLQDSSLQATNVSGENTAPSNQPETAKLSNEVAECSGQVSPTPAATPADPSRVQERSLYSAATHGEAENGELRLLASPSQNSEVPTSFPSPGGQSICEEGESTDPSSTEKDLIRGTGGDGSCSDPAKQRRPYIEHDIGTPEHDTGGLPLWDREAGRWDLEAYGKSLLRRHQASLAKYVADPRLWQQALPVMQHLVSGSRETVEQIVMDATEPACFDALASAALEKCTLSAKAVWQLVLALQEMEPPLKPFLVEIRADPDADLFFQAVGSRDGIATEILLGHSALISAVLQREAVLEALLPGEAELVKAVKELLSLSLTEEASTASWRAALSSALDRSLPASQICDLLCCLQGSCPDLQPVMQELQQAGLLTEGGGEKAGAWQRKGTSASQGEVAGEGEPKARPSEGAASKKGLACRTCRKSFHFFCRLKVHEKRCRVARQRQVQCQGRSRMRAAQKEPEKRQKEAHGSPGSATATRAQRKKQQRLPVACDICGREFAHASGMQYHKLTEHFDEKPFSCEECGAKFAANSTLQNHQRLHSGDRPFVCKHCPAAFSQASALAYHAKRKHAEGKMYACQYCTAVFAQCIELSRHVRTHTGDKPYVCRECGKGFRQANGLSIHLRTFHNIDDPYDCKKCQMSFSTLQEHQQHIHAAHSREYHPCQTCGKVFSAPSLLERHMVTHVGGKPFSCEICNKAYQQLSGLWYHNRTHHPDIFAAQNHRSSKFSSLQCGSCDKAFSSTAAYRKHAKEDHAGVTFYECEKCRGLFPTLTLLQAHMKGRHPGSPSFPCPHCSASFHLQEALQNHVASEHSPQADQSLGCGLCGELFPGQEQLEEHCSAEHPKVVFADAKVPATHIVQVIQAPEQVITLAESELAGSQVFLTLPDSQGHPSGRAELVTVTMEDLLNKKVTLICQDAK